MEASFSEPWVLHPTAQHTHTFIILHGRGDGGETFGRGFLEYSTTASGLTLPEIFQGMKFICPTARKGRPAMSPNSLLHQWFDISSLKDPSKREDLQVDGLRGTVQFVHSLISREAELIPPKNIILGGLSQGCAAALSAFMTLDLTLGAFVGMSGWLPFVGHLEDIIKTPVEEHPGGIPGFGEAEKRPGTRLQVANLLRKILGLEPFEPTTDGIPPPFQTPVLIGHGDIDSVVDIRLGKQIYETVVALEMDATLKVYEDFGHWYMVPEELDDIANFLFSKKAGVALEGWHSSGPPLPLPTS
ncbi:hypothetical protein FGG08_004613 [Glutinoglossum americanum]|uniref:Acyl-protein thioesterase 1 n=1 Tax=Glutinoglossum americanum TaxID=1670608 RepID=A0A9P8I4S3_9PEZI|nr:hypothetical protein FGG08_004613 [Glutinoglossum americanum]